MNQNHQEIFNTVENSLREFENYFQYDSEFASLPSNFDPISRYRNAASLRFIELVQNSLEHLKRNHIISALTLIRSAMETAATFADPVRSFSDNDSIDDLEKKFQQILQMIICTRLKELKEDVHERFKKERPDCELPELEAPTVLNYIDNCGKDFRRRYDEFCEFAHPNYLGVLGAAPLSDQPRNHYIKIALKVLKSTLDIFAESFTRYPKFIKLFIEKNTNQQRT